MGEYTVSINGLQQGTVMEESHLQAAVSFLLQLGQISASVVEVTDRQHGLRRTFYNARLVGSDTGRFSLDYVGF